MRIRTYLTYGVAAGLGLLAAGPASAFFEFELKSGGTVVADSYVEEGDVLRLYRPSGELKLERDRVATIRERDGALVEESRPVAAKPPPEPAAEVSAAAPLPPIDPNADLGQLEQQLTKDLILGHRELLFAKNRGDDEAELKRRRRDLDRIQKRREQVLEQLGAR